MKRYKDKKNSAFSLIEVLIVVAIIAILALIALISIRNERQKAEDVRIKTDLQRLKVAFEDYRNDHNCYPPTEWFDSADDCNSTLFQPYLNNIPCDPRTRLPYKLEYVDGQCHAFRLYANLQNLADPAITSLCVSSGGSTLGNYGISSSNITVAIDCTSKLSSSPSPSSTSSPTPLPSIPITSPGPYACQSSVCNNYGYPNTCTVSFNNKTICQEYCATEGSISCH